MTLFRRPANGPRLTEMASTIGLDLETATARGSVKPHELRAAATHCGECRSHRDCATWLQTHADGNSAAPGFCPNRGLYARLVNTTEG